ncbi:GNAT family N-acetyltransferase [Micromonospora pattaloongensis]|uniref:GNAT family N-acetyltransferase n=1 Tax=Micromonospora pattaloongensis TaxID=405436 RepID=UPI00158728B3|nr:GNAT family N-acetyltransferase [Micromonospora pattaloongensis]
MTAERPPVEMVGNCVVVRHFSPADATRLHEAILESVEHLAPWMPWAGLEPVDLADREKLVADWCELWQAGKDFNFGVFENGRLVGGCGLHRRIGPGGLEIGYWTRAGDTGRGIAREAVRCLVTGAFSMSNIAILEVHHDVANIASGRIPERLGFTFVEEREDGAVAPAEIGVERVWRLHRRDWDAVGPRS